MNTLSVITPVFYGKKYLLSLKQILEKNADFVRNSVSVEWIIYNDSPQDSIENHLISDFISIKIKNAKWNNGTQYARIRGLEESTGEYIFFLDQDDRIADDWIKSQFDHIGDADAVVCDALMDGRSFYGDELRPSFDEALTLKFNLSGVCGFIPGQVLMKRSAISEAWKRNRFSVNHCDDYYLWLCMLLEGKKFVKNPDVLYEHITTGNNQSLNSVIWHRSMLEMIGFLEKDNMVNDSQKTKLYSNLNSITESFLEDRNWIIEKNMMLQGLLETYEKRITLSERLLSRGFSNVAIYGKGECGSHLARKLISEGFEVKAFIDRVEFPNSEIPVYKRESIPRGIQCVINTLAKNKIEISNYLTDRYADICVIHLKDILF